MNKTETTGAVDAPKQDRKVRFITACNFMGVDRSVKDEPIMVTKHHRDFLVQNKLAEDA